MRSSLREQTDRALARLPLLREDRAHGCWIGCGSRVNLHGLRFMITLQLRMWRSSHWFLRALFGPSSRCPFSSPVPASSEALDAVTVGLDTKPSKVFSRTARSRSLQRSKRLLVPWRPRGNGHGTAVVTSGADDGSLSIRSVLFVSPLLTLFPSGECLLICVPVVVENSC